MCMCKHATGSNNINGQPGYCWNDAKHISVRPVNPPDLQDGDTLLYDLPGRCGRGTDSHCHHFRIVKAQWGGKALLVRHGGGDERIDLGSRAGVSILDSLSDEDRYWLCQMLYHTQEHAAREARDKANAMWRKAATEKRIKTRKFPARGYVKVWIEDVPETAVF